MFDLEMQAKLQQERWGDMIREAQAARRQAALLRSLEDTSSEGARRGWLNLAWPRVRALVAARRPSQA